MLNNSQLLAVKNEILSDPLLSSKPMNSDGAYDIAVSLNAIYSPDLWVWKTSIQTQDIFDAITWANFTPQDAPDGTTSWTNRSLACQGKQFNVQTLLVGREFINPSKQNIRAGLQDALTAIPSGAGGANKSAGWANVLATLYRKATRFEKLFAAGAGTTASPATLVVEGLISYQEVEQARGM